MSQRWPVLLMVRELGIGGCERDLTKIAVGLDKSRFEPHVACFNGSGLRAAEIHAAGLPVLELPVRSLLKPSLLQGIVRFGSYVRRHRIRLIHAFDVPTTIFGVPAARLFGLRGVGSQLSYRDLYRKQDIAVLRWTDRIADAVVVNSKAVLHHLVEEEKVAPSKIVVSYNGVDPSEFHPGPGIELPQLAGATDIVGVVAALRPEKRLDLLVRAFSEASASHSDARLLIVGSGPELSKLEALAKEKRVANRVVFVPARPDVAPYMRAMDIFVLPSRSESFPNALLEAMACGCAVIGSRVGGIPELVRHDDTGLLFDPGNYDELVAALRRLLDRPDLRRQIATAAADSAISEFGIHLAVERLQALYSRLLL